MKWTLDEIHRATMALWHAETRLGEDHFRRESIRNQARWRASAAAVLDVIPHPSEERELVVTFLYKQADEHFGPGQMYGEFCAQLADQIKAESHLVNNGARG